MANPRGSRSRPWRGSKNGVVGKRNKTGRSAQNNDVGTATTRPILSSSMSAHSAKHQITTSSPLSTQQPIKKNMSPPRSMEVISGLSPEQDFLILDRRHEDSPGIPLIRLPNEPTTPRWSRYTCEGVFKFLELPGELRNKIYDYFISKEHYDIHWVNKNQKSKTLTYGLNRKTAAREPKLLPDVAQRRRSLDFYRRDNKSLLPEGTIHHGPTVLLFINKLISEEAASVFYSKSMFHFSGLSTTRHFLNHLRPICTKSITRLSLSYRAYGNAKQRENQCWKDRHDRTWESLCWRLTDTCTALTHLALDLTLNTSPLTFVPFDQVQYADMGASWIKPLWAFQDAGIQRCWGRIHCAGKDSSVLEVESWKMRKEILGDLWDEDAERKRDAYGWERGKKRPKESGGDMTPLVRTLHVDPAQVRPRRVQVKRKDGFGCFFDGQ